MRLPDNECPANVSSHLIHAIADMPDLKRLDALHRAWNWAGAAMYAEPWDLCDRNRWHRVEAALAGAIDMHIWTAGERVFPC